MPARFSHAPGPAAHPAWPENCFRSFPILWEAHHTRGQGGCPNTKVCQSAAEEEGPERPPPHANALKHCSNNVARGDSYPHYPPLLKAFFWEVPERPNLNVAGHLVHQ